MNNKFILLLSFCFITCYSNITAQVFQNKELSISKLEDNMWVVETSDKTCMYIVEGEKKAMLIDTGTKCAKLDQIVKQITKKPLYVVITHAHGDHDGNIGFFKEIYMHPADTGLLNKKYKGKINFVKDGDVFDLGGKIIEVSHMPAHTPGSIVLFDKKAGNCYSGDAFGSGQVWLQLKPYAPIKTYINSCEEMEKFMENGITKIYCGHYPYTKKAFDKSYMDSMLKIAKALDNGTETGAKPYPTIVGECKDPMMATDGEANIVYAPDHLK
jgi:glyoxylase-like metal-dependent hydrolase (beta-lactamase superfamily II)